MSNEITPLCDENVMFLGRLLLIYIINHTKLFFKEILLEIKDIDHWQKRTTKKALLAFWFHKNSLHTLCVISKCAMLCLWYSYLKMYLKHSQIIFSAKLEHVVLTAKVNEKSQNLWWCNFVVWMTCSIFDGLVV